MGPTVRLLDDTLVDQIAAGEVIERPANLVKELVENSIDAGASAITVTVEDGGRGQVRVIDDGVGMSPEDAALAVQRHATSKIRSFEDLTTVATLGFRGEALPSIGSVSRMTITTRPKADLEGTRVVVEGGALREVAPAGCPPGTSVEVADLFYNVPARRKFLRARQTETSRIFEVCQRAALSHPALRLVVRSDGRTARQYLPAEDLAERAAQIFGELELHPVRAERDGIVLEAHLCAPGLARPGARQLSLLINGRPIADRGLARAIAFAYGDRLPPGHYPRGVVSIGMPSEEVDVNAHPQKSEVRFRRTAQLLDLITRMLASRLPSSAAEPDYWEARLDSRRPAEAAAPDESLRGTARGVAESQTTYGPPLDDGLGVVAQVRDALLVCEGHGELLIVDRQRADASRRLEALEDATARGRVAKQNLLFPDRVQLSASERNSLDMHAELLSTLGFEWSDLGGDVTALRAVPAILADAPAGRLFGVALAVLERSAEQRNVLRALAEAGATPNGERLDGEAARRIAASITAASGAIVARVPLPEVDADESDV